MTHAALKDLLKKWRNGGLSLAGIARNECADELSAALSAMEGEAVRDDELPGMWSNTDFTGGDPDERSHHERTAPPPQQAASEGVQLQRWGRGPEPHPYLLQRLEDGYWTPWHIAQAAVNAATQPQQAGGEMLGRLKAEVREVVYLMTKKPQDKQELINLAGRLDFALKTMEGGSSEK